ncbi:hypothetical protein TI04_09960 [Achromatium sp. WMS2]|nr:hypothetical protein TI04_09960 [Achromatium sp. WMS2]
MISDDNSFRAALRSLNNKDQRLAAAKFVEHVLPLCEDIRLIQAIRIACNDNASRLDLAEAFKIAKSSALHSHARYGSEGDWRRQAGYFVARAAIAALAPSCQMPEGVAWHAALSSRLARASEAIDNGEDKENQEREDQYQILTSILEA